MLLFLKYNIYKIDHVTEIYVFGFNNLALYPNSPCFSKSAFKMINFGSKFNGENLALMTNN